MLGAVLSNLNKATEVNRENDLLEERLKAYVICHAHEERLAVPWLWCLASTASLAGVQRLQLPIAWRSLAVFCELSAETEQSAAGRLPKTPLPATHILAQRCR